MSARSDLVRRVALGVTLLGLLAAAVDGCGFPEYTYDLPEGTGGKAGDASTDASGGSAGQSGGAGTGGVAGQAQGGASGEGGASGTGGASGEGGASGTGGASGEGGASGTGGASGEGGVSGSGGADLDASDADVSDDQAVDVVEEEAAADVVGDEPLPDVIEAGQDADAADVVDAPQEVGSECPSSVENCTNGVDDDCDNKIDCADPDCSPLYKCVSPPPAGWTGWYQLYEGTSPPDCAAPFSTLDVAAGANPLNTPATCSTCSCGAPVGTQCTEPALVIWQNTSCASGPAWGWEDDPPNSTPLKPHNTCLKYTLTCDGGGPCPNPPGSAAINTPAQHIAGTGTCSPSGVVVTKSEPDFQTLAAACKADSVGAGCGASGVCAPKPSTASGMKKGMCIYQAGVVSVCPSPYTQRFVYYQSITDTRSCSSCSCGGAYAVNCLGTFTISSNPGCDTGIEAQMTQPSVCETGVLPTYTKYLRYSDPLDPGGVCDASGGQPTGTVAPDPTSAYTFCCTPF